MNYVLGMILGITNGLMICLLVYWIANALMTVPDEEEENDS